MSEWNVHERLTAHLDWQEKCGWHHDWPEALAALRAALAVHRLDPTGQACAGCSLASTASVPLDECETLKALAETLVVGEVGDYL